MEVQMEISKRFTLIDYFCVCLGAVSIALLLAFGSSMSSLADILLVVVLLLEVFPWYFKGRRDVGANSKGRFEQGVFTGELAKFSTAQQMLLGFGVPIIAFALMFAVWSGVKAF